MICTMYLETCSLCEYEESIGEDTIFYEKKKESIQGEENSIKTCVKNKSTAKRYFVKEGWRHHKGSSICPHCFVKLKDGYVVIDRFNQLYNERGIYDFPDVDCILPKDLAIELSSCRHNNEDLKVKKAFLYLTKMLNHEIESDVVGYHQAHPEVKFVIDIPGF